MASYAPAAEPAPRRRRVEAAPAARPRRARTGASQRRLAGGAVWIALAGVLLAGVVAVNVAVLRLNLRLDELGRERAELRAETARLQSRLAGAAATYRIQEQAAARLGLVPAEAASTTYVRLGARSR